MKTRVLDSWPILEWMNNRQPATDALERLFDEARAGRARLLMSAINVGEVYYFLRKNHTETVAESWRQLSGTFPSTIDVPTADGIWDAAILKGQYPISYADAFAAALAKRHHCPLVTGDPEFRVIQGLELDWLNRL